MAGVYYDIKAENYAKNEEMKIKDEIIVIRKCHLQHVPVSHCSNTFLEKNCKNSIIIYMGKAQMDDTYYQTMPGGYIAFDVEGKTGADIRKYWVIDKSDLKNMVKATVKLRVMKKLKS